MKTYFVANTHSGSKYALSVFGDKVLFFYKIRWMDDI